MVATLGAVAEPKLPAFPKPDDFFPLLLTGKLTLAEVYWKTNPMVSWMISFIGDPLYTPYKLHPPMALEDLPPGLRNAFAVTDITIAPQTQPIQVVPIIYRYVCYVRPDHLPQSAMPEDFIRPR